MDALNPNAARYDFRPDEVVPQFDAAASVAATTIVPPESEPFRSVNDPDGQYDIDHQFADKSRDSDVGLFYFTRGHR